MMKSCVQCTSVDPLMKGKQQHAFPSLALISPLSGGDIIPTTVNHKIHKGLWDREQQIMFCYEGAHAYFLVNNMICHRRRYVCGDCSPRRFCAILWGSIAPSDRALCFGLHSEGYGKNTTHMSLTVLGWDQIGWDRIGKDRIGKDRIGKAQITKPTDRVQRKTRLNKSRIEQFHDCPTYIETIA
ncbi:hypothetical protein ABVT39_027723 [Epinephelus coioides]